MTSRRDLLRWLREDWTHQAAVYALVVLTISLVVQIVATVFLGVS